jgi:hypothetical protein
MSIRMEKPWIDLTAEAVKALPGQLGVYQLADGGGRVVYIGFAGGRSLFGLRSELERALRDRPAGAARFRVEVNQQYTTRYQELLMLHGADHGSLPVVNQEDPPPRLGRLSPLGVIPAKAGIHDT